MFEKLKNEVKNIISESYDKEIYPNSNNKNIGIYMIYIDNFDDDKIIPIYIGKTGYGKNRNFQNRYKEHIQEVMALNRLKYSYYKETLLSNFYDGHYKACKIFKYMVDHKCTLKDFHMIVLEEVKTETDNIEELLEKKEKEYISKYLPTFFGFNQINSVSEGIKEMFNSIKQFGKIEFSDKLLEYSLEDCENFIKYFGYGYTKFNYYHCYQSYQKLFKAKNDDRKIAHTLEEKNNILKSKYYDENKFKKYEENLPKLQRKQKRVKNNFENCKNQFKEVYEPNIKEYCLNNKIGIIQKYDEIKNILIYQDEKRIIDFKNYLKRKKISVNILDIFNKDYEFVKLRKKYVKYEAVSNELEYKVKEYMYAKRTDDLLRLLPENEYDLFPLKDRYQEIKFGDLKDNELVINFEFSNTGLPANTWDCYEFSLLKVDYKLNLNNNIIEKKNIFIKYEEDYFPINYYEKYRHELKRNPFNVMNGIYYISTSMEYNNGINEYTLREKEKVEIKTILDEINLLINEQTIVKVQVRSRLKNKCIQFIKEKYNSENTLKNKLIDKKSYLI